MNVIMKHVSIPLGDKKSFEKWRANIKKRDDQLLQGEYVAHFKFTVLLLPSGTHRITGLPFDLSLYKTDLEISNPEIQALLSTPANPKSVRKKKKAEKVESEGAPPATADE